MLRRQLKSVSLLALIALCGPAGAQAQAVSAPAATPGAHASDAPHPAPVRRAALDLRAPDIRRLVPESQWRAPLVMPGEQPQDVDVVQVRGERSTPAIPAGIASIFWALAHPTESWRVLAPAQ